MRGGVVTAVLAALSVASCATPPKHGPPQHGPSKHGRPSTETPQPVTPRRPQPPAAEVEPRRVPVAALPGWAGEDFAGAFVAFIQTCAVVRERALADVCFRARSAGALGPGDVRAFFEQAFEAERIGGEGVLTAYFAPVYQARRRAGGDFTAPVRPKPADLRIAQDGTVLRMLAGAAAEPYPERAAIEATSIDPPLAWMRPEELFFLQVQGSGVLIFEDRTRLKALYAAHNGRPFVGIANPMHERGLLARDNTSGDAIRGWLAAHRGPEADEIMRLNPRYAFFRLAPDDGRPPAGAANLPLPSGRAVAIDPAFHSYGELLWIEGAAPLLAGAFPTYRRLVSALDTGGAIKGEVRADLYLGQGDAAGAEAGRVRHTLRLWRLVPR